MNKQNLINKFKALNVDDPEAWAESQIEEGINQLSRAKALSMMWRGVLKEGDVKKLRTISKISPNPDEPFGLYGYILNKILDSGISEQEMLYFIRCNQVEMISRITGCSDGISKENKETSSICICDVTGKNVELPDSLHESVLEFDENEMRPNKKLIKILKNDPDYIKRTK